MGNNAMNLPKNAWLNAKMYADTAFPANPVPGDRILRTDEDTDKGGRWYTYTVASGIGYWVPDALRGTATFTGTGTSTTTAVSFGLTLPAVPSVSLSLNTGWSGYLKTIPHPVSVSVTGFSILLAATDGASLTWTSAVCSWVAIP